MRKTYSFLLEEETIEALDAMARTEWRSRSNMAEIIIRAGIASYKKKSEQEAAADETV